MSNCTVGPEQPAFATALCSADGARQNDGVAAAIGLGAAAVPVLLSLMQEPGVPRAQLVYALSEIGDPRARPAFAAALADADEAVRAYAARGLARLGDAAALDACLAALDDAAGPAHQDRTPAVDALGEMGLAAVPGLLDRLLADSDMTRLHAQRALESVLDRRHGFEPGRGFATPQHEAAARAEWQANGDYDHAASATQRAAAVTLWRRWLETARETS
jgi:hypothetical protein